MLLSQEGLNAKKKQLDNLREQLIELQQYKGQVAINSGDAWHDNNDFEQTEIEERRLLTSIRMLEEEIESAELVNEEIHQNYVALNSSVKLQLTFDDGEQEILDFVLIDVSTETSPSEITLNSPLGKSIYQKKIGDEGFYTSPAGDVKYKILDIK